MSYSPPPILRIAARLRAVRVELTARAARLALVHAVAAIAVLTLLATLALGLAPSAVLRTLALTAMGAALLAAIAFTTRRWLALRRDEHVAACIEDVVPALRSDVRTALAFVHDTAPPADAGLDTDAAALREGLRKRLVERIARELDNRATEIDAALPRPDATRAATVAMGAAVTLAALLLLWPTVAGEGLRTLLRGVPPAAEHTADLHGERPLIEAVDVELNYPAYTNMGRRQVRGTLGDFRAMPGTDVVWRTRAIEDVSRARLILGDDDDAPAIALQPGPDRTLEARFTVTTSTSYRVEVVTSTGGALADPRHRRISVDADNPPAVELSAPEDQDAVGTEEVIDFVYSISDDFGLRNVQLVWHFENDEDRRRTIALHDSLSTRSIEGSAQLDLGALRVQPRDTLVAWIEATDNDTVSGPNVGRSRTVLLRVASPDAVNMEVLALKEALFEAALDQLGAMLPATLNTWSADAERQRLTAQPRTIPAEARTQALTDALAPHAAWTEILDLWSRLLERMAEDIYSEPRDTELLSAARERLYNLERDQAAIALEAEGPLATGRLSEALFQRAVSHDASHIEATERAVLLLDDLLASHRRDLVARTMEELAESRERLRELLQELRDTDDPDLREQILDEITRLESRMQELMQRLRDQMEQSPREHLNTDAFEPSELAESLTEMSSALDDLRSMVEQGDIDGALQALDALEQGMDPFEDEFGSPGDPGQLSEFQREMGEILEEVNNLAELERFLEEETEALLEEARRAAAEGMQEQVDQAFQRAREVVEQLRERMDGIDPQHLAPDSRQQLEDVQSGLERLQGMTESEDVAGTRDVAERQRREMMEAGWTMFPNPEASGAAERQRAARESAEAERALREGVSQLNEVAQRMEQLQQQAQPRFGQEGQQQMQQLSEDQGVARERLDALQQRVDELSGEMPGVGEQLGPSFEQARRSMRSAEGQLQRGDAEGALGSERSARQQLESLRQQMQQMSSRRDRGQSGRQTSRDRVEVPEDSETDRRGFRREVQDAMREDRVESYDEELQRYYERLVR